jgi:tRNA pseudouridine38-40 synthase
MSRYFIELAYKGKNFHGFQLQKNIKPTVQESLNDALSILLSEKVETVGSSRTDTGVHAQQNFVHLDTEAVFPKDAIRRLNFLLPFEIELKNIIPVKLNAHARFDAIGRYYEYQITYRKNPYITDFACFYPYHMLDIDKLNSIADYLKSHTDFKSFSKKNTDALTSICNISLAKWEWDDEKDLLVFKVQSNRFLRGMVRALVQTSIQVHRGKISMNQLADILASREPHKTDFSAPANGLSLMKVIYPEGYFNISQF